ncbi:MAG: SIS domain-containing protein [Erysipelotrichaceae bacterium]|nr:SIS domain-containing protein [Erysipelotrichaceae bacterium]
MENRDNNLKNGFEGYPEFAEKIVNMLTDGRISKAIPEDKIRKIRRVVITGNGDSYSAALATREFNSRMFMNRDYHALRCIDVARHFVYPTEHPEETLVIVISVSGGGSRVTEAMKRATMKGCTTLAITGHPESRMAAEAQHILKIEIDPPKPGTPYTPANQTKSYFTALLTTIMFGAYAGILLGTFTSEKLDALKKEIVDYVRNVCSSSVLDRVDDQMYELAKTWKDYLGFGFVGGGSDFSTAYFGVAKFFELNGSLNCLNDSEDWCHIDYFQKDRDKIGTIFVASKNCASFSRTAESIASAKKSDRNVLVVSDAGKEEFYEGVEVVTLPATEHDYVNPIMNFIPLFMLGNYIALLRNYPYFGGTGDDNPLFSQSGNINTIKSSKIVIVD